MSGSQRSHASVQHIVGALVLHHELERQVIPFAPGALYSAIPELSSTLQGLLVNHPDIESYRAIQFFLAKLMSSGVSMPA